MQKPVWVDVMVDKYDSIVSNSVWDVVPRPTTLIKPYPSRLSKQWLQDSVSPSGNEEGRHDLDSLIVQQRQ